jgi:hypothetical protein
MPNQPLGKALMYKSSKLNFLYVGYEAPHTLGINREPPSLTIGESGDLGRELLDFSSTLPSRIVLRFQIQGQPISQDTSIQLSVDDEWLSQAPLYRHQTPCETFQGLAKQSAYANIRLIFEGYGFWTSQGSERHPLGMLSAQHLSFAFKPGDVCYQKFFETEQAKFIREKHFTEAECHITTDSFNHVIATKGLILRPYGGTLDDNPLKCRQVFYALTETYPNQTQITLTTWGDDCGQFSWTDSLQAGLIVFSPHPLGQTVFSSLGGDLRTGKMSISLALNALQVSEKIAQSYSSVDYEIVEENMIDVHFVPTSHKGKTV